MLQSRPASTDAACFFVLYFFPGGNLLSMRAAQEDKEDEGSFEWQETSREEMKGGARKKEGPHVREPQPP